MGPFECTPTQPSRQRSAALAPSDKACEAGGCSSLSSSSACSRRQTPRAKLTPKAMKLLAFAVLACVLFLSSAEVQRTDKNLFFELNSTHDIDPRFAFVNFFLPYDHSSFGALITFHTDPSNAKDTGVRMVFCKTGAECTYSTFSPAIQRNRVDLNVVSLTQEPNVTVHIETFYFKQQRLPTSLGVFGCRKPISNAKQSAYLELSFSNFTYATYPVAVNASIQAIVVEQPELKSGESTTWECSDMIAYSCPMSVLFKVGVEDLDADKVPESYKEIIVPVTVTVSSEYGQLRMYDATVWNSPSCMEPDGAILHMNDTDKAGPYPANVTYTVNATRYDLEVAKFWSMTVRTSSTDKITVKWSMPVHSGGLSPLALGLIIGGAALAGAVIVGLLIYYFKTKAKSGYEAV